jgi:hypothetical protein
MFYALYCTVLYIELTFHMTACFCDRFALYCRTFSNQCPSIVTGTAFLDMLTSKPHSDAIPTSTSNNNIHHDTFDSVSNHSSSANSTSSGSGSTVQPTSQQEQFKSQFRASMRAKYLRKA